MNAIERARLRAGRLYTSQGFQGAYVKGAAARLHGRPVEACPYKMSRGSGWQAWHRAWVRGWMSVEARRSADDD